MQSLVNVIFPNSKVQSTIPKGDKLLPVADLTWIFDNKLILFKCSFRYYASLIQLLVALVLINALQSVEPTFIGKVVPCSDLITTSSA